MTKNRLGPADVIRRALGASGVFMSSAVVLRGISAIRDCALFMLETASFIQRELPNVEMHEAFKS